MRIRVIYIYLSILLFKCTTFKSSEKCSNSKENIKIDTISHSFNKVYVKDSIIYNIIDSLKQGYTKENRIIPLFGQISYSMNDNDSSSIFLYLTNDYTEVTDEFFRSLITGMFQYKEINFYIHLSDAEIKKQKYFEISNEKLQSYVIQTSVNNVITIPYFNILYRQYLIHGNQFILESKGDFDDIEVD